MEYTEPSKAGSVATQKESTPRSLHTPGPWTCDGRAIIAGGARHMLRDGVGWSQADAYLIAAAPDMLEALKDAETDFACYEGDPKYSAKNGTLKAIRSAITKAEGAPSVQEGNEVR